MSAWSTLLGNKFLKKDGSVVGAEAVEGKTIAVYCSAVWCPPCRKFTPMLATFYEEYKQLDPNFEIIFCSSDKDESSFLEYFKEHHGDYLAFEFNSDARKNMKAHVNTRGIPCLAVYDKTGKLLTKDGTGMVHGGSAKSVFESKLGWSDPTYADCMPENFIKKDGSKVASSTLDGKTVGFYCSASWCPPCRQFTPNLAKFYEQYKEKEPNFEIVFVSSDKDEAAFDDYFKSHHGDYLSFEYNSPERKMMASLIDADGIPTFAVYKNGKLVNKGGRGVVDGGVKNALENGWEPPLLTCLDEDVENRGFSINEKPSLIVRCAAADDDEQESIEKALTSVSKELKTDDEPDVLFFISKQMQGPSAKVAEMVSKGGDKAAENPHMIMFCIPKGGYYESKETDITPAAVKQFIADVKADKVTLVNF
eukprot:TRINITY_DN33984_c0_g1_i1.p1 TRINITY_DN33984_c0_g1~~TRINITY_DN33984_c0_g1_i1.p1  ORF type:complete len:434 (+),score=103.30 TRINITY_DN33984_c0_g1_i1:42-1304(+)